jgi:hypothetical protein
VELTSVLREKGLQQWTQKVALVQGTRTYLAWVWAACLFELGAVFAAVLEGIFLLSLLLSIQKGKTRDWQHFGCFIW